jgi:hypothetical protein
MQVFVQLKPDPPWQMKKPLPQVVVQSQQDPVQQAAPSGSQGYQLSTQASSPQTPLVQVVPSTQTPPSQQGCPAAPHTHLSASPGGLTSHPAVQVSRPTVSEIRHSTRSSPSQ